MCLALGLLGLPGRGWAQAYVGPENCRACHAAAYDAWAASPHGRAQESLTGKNAKDGRCLQCHAPQLDKGVANVSCESCHGPGQFYAPAYVMKDSELARAVGLEDPGEKSCRVCHDQSSPSLKPFEFKSKLKLIDHWSGDAKAPTGPQGMRPPGHPRPTFTPVRMALHAALAQSGAPIGMALVPVSATPAAPGAPGTLSAHPGQAPARVPAAPAPAKLPAKAPSAALQGSPASPGSHASRSTSPASKPATSPATPTTPAISQVTAPGAAPGKVGVPAPKATGQARVAPMKARR